MSRSSQRGVFEFPFIVKVHSLRWGTCGSLTALVITGACVLDTALVGEVSLLVVLMVRWFIASGAVMRAS